MGDHRPRADVGVQQLRSAPDRRPETGLLRVRRRRSPGARPEGGHRRAGHRGADARRRILLHLFPGNRQPVAHRRASGRGSRDRRTPPRAAGSAHADIHLLVPDADPRRGVDLLHAADAGRRQRPGGALVRPEPRAAHRRGPGQGHVLRRGRRRRGEGGSPRAGRLPARPRKVPEARRQDPPRRADGGIAGHRQDPARQGHRGRGKGPVLHHIGLGFRRDVRRGRRVAGARHVRSGEEACPLHHLHRRDRCGRPAPRGRLGRGARRARADPQPVAGRDGRFRRERGGSSSSRPPTGRTCWIRRFCARAVSIGRWWFRSPTSGGGSRSSGCTCARSRSTPT